MTNAEFTILSLIVEQPRHGYEIEQVIAERGMRDWTEVGFSSIYYLLKKLEKAELIRSQSEPAEGRGPARKVYYPTDAGVDACKQATIVALETPHRSYAPIQLGMANLENLPLTEAIAALQRHRDGLAARLANIENRRSGQPLPEIVAAMFDYSHTMVSAEMDWIEKFIQQLAQKQ